MLTIHQNANSAVVDSDGCSLTVSPMTEKLAPWQLPAFNIHNNITHKPCTFGVNEHIEAETKCSPLKNIPLFAKICTSMDVRFGPECGRKFTRRLELNLATQNKPKCGLFSQLLYLHL